MSDVSLGTQTVEAEKATLVEQLKSSIDREARLEEEISRLTDGLAASEAELQSVGRAIDGEVAPTSDATPTPAGAPVASELFPMQEVDFDE